MLPRLTRRRCRGDSLRLDVGLANGLAPALVLAVEEILEILRAAGVDLKAAFEELLADCGIAQHRVDLAIEQRDNGGRHVGWTEHALPWCDGQRHALFGECGRVRCTGGTLRRRHREDAHLARTVA